MENFLFGIENIAYNINSTTLALLRHPLVWGFILGFSASSLIHLFVITDRPTMIPQMLRKKPKESFETIAKSDESNTYLISYTKYRQDVNKVRIVFYSALLAFLVVVIITLIRF